MYIYVYIYIGVYIVYLYIYNAQSHQYAAVAEFLGVEFSGLCDCVRKQYYSAFLDKCGGDGIYADIHWVIGN